MTKTIKVENLGPVHSVTIPIPEGGGVVVLRGRNGAGKSETLEAVTKMLGREAAPPTPLDGHERGKIEGVGVTMTVGRTTRRTGELEVLSLDSRLSIADIVDPGIDNPESADEKRMKAILSILQVKPEAEDWLPVVERLAEYDVSIEDFLATEVSRANDVLILASRLKSHISRYAANDEEEGKKAKAAVGVLASDPRVMAHDGPEPPRPLAELAANLTKANAAIGKLEAQRDRASAAAAYRVDLARLKTATFDLPAIEKAIEETGDEVDRLREELEAAEGKLAKLGADRRLAVQHTNDVADLEKKVAASEAPTEEEFTAAKEAQKAAMDAMASYEDTRQLLANRQKAADASATAVSCDLRAKALREVASLPESILAQMVASRVDGVRFDSGRLIVTHPKRGDIPFAELSTGERWKFAIQVAICGVGEGGLLVVPQDAWQDLDPLNRKRVAKLCGEAGVVILTAECSADKELTPSIVE